MTFARVTASALIFVALAACGGSSDGDAVFVQKATIAGMFEVQSSQLALTKATNADLKAFAQTMITDHSQAGAELKTLVDGGSVPGVSRVPDALDSAHQAKLSELENAEGATFDTKYRAMQVDAHQDAVDLFQDESEHSKNAALKDWAGKTLPTLQQHKAHIDGIVLQ